MWEGAGPPSPCRVPSPPPPPRQGGMLGYPGIRLGCGTSLHLTILLIGTLPPQKVRPKSRGMVLGWQHGCPSGAAGRWVLCWLCWQLSKCQWRQPRSAPGADNRLIGAELMEKIHLGSLDTLPWAFITPRGSAGHRPLPAQIPSLPAGCLGRGAGGMWGGTRGRIEGVK